MSNWIDWKARSGATYRYWFLDNPTAEGILAVAGNYAFVRQLTDGKWQPVYFGEAVDLSRRIPGHERWEEARRLGATRVMAHTTQGGVDARCAEERDLIALWNPQLNSQHRSVG